jgi:hypothetical protein
MVNHPNRSVDYPEPSVPSGHEAGSWISFGQINGVAYMLGVNKLFEMKENMDVAAKLQNMISEGRVQKWKRGPHQQSPAFYRLIWKK